MLTNKKLIVHGCLLGALILYTMFAWGAEKTEAADAEKAAEEAFYNGDLDPYAEVKLAEKGGGTAAGAMARVGVPLFIAIVYGGILTVLYILPMFVDKLGEEMMGSSAEVEGDPLDDARAAVAEGDYTEAIQVYRKVWLENRENRFPVVEIAKLQRTKLESPAVAVSTLEEALDDHEWEVDDAAFLMFRIAEIYEEDLDDRDSLIATLKKVTEKLEGTRHAANAAHKLGGMEKA